MSSFVDESKQDQDDDEDGFFEPSFLVQDDNDHVKTTRRRNTAEDTDFFDSLSVASSPRQPQQKMRTKASSLSSNYDEVLDLLTSPDVAFSPMTKRRSSADVVVANSPPRFTPAPEGDMQRTLFSSEESTTAVSYAAVVAKKKTTNEGLATTMTTTKVIQKGNESSLKMNDGPSTTKKISDGQATTKKKASSSLPSTTTRADVLQSFATTSPSTSSMSATTLPTTSNQLSAATEERTLIACDVKSQASSSVPNKILSSASDVSEPRKTSNAKAVLPSNKNSSYHSPVPSTDVSTKKKKKTTETSANVARGNDVKPKGRAISPPRDVLSSDVKEHDDDEQAALKLAREWNFKHELPSDMSSLVFTVGEPKVFGGSTSPLVTLSNSISDGHVRFKITRSLLQVSPQFVHRRYRDFQALSLRLAHVFPDRVLPGLPSSWQTLLKTDEFLQVRSRRLEGFLVALLKKKCPSSGDVAAFLLKDSEAFDEMATKYLSNNGQDLDTPPPSVSTKVGESLSFWMRTAIASSSSTAAAVPETTGQLAASFEALNAWVDPAGVVQDRGSTVERLTTAFESYLALVQSRGDTLKAMGEAFKDFEDSVAFDPSFDETYARGLIGQPKALNDESRRDGPLRNLHQCAALLGGAKDIFTRVVSNNNPPSSELVSSLSKQFASLKRTTSRTALEVTQEFAELSLRRATAELEALKELQRKMRLEED